MHGRAADIAAGALTALMISVGASSPAMAGAIPSRYTITELGPYTATNWGQDTNGRFSYATQAAVRIDDAGNLSYRNALPVSARMGMPYGGPMPADLDTGFEESIWAAGSAGRYTVGDYYNRAGQKILFLSDGATVRTFADESGQPTVLPGAVGVNELGQIITTGWKSWLVDPRDGSVNSIGHNYSYDALAINNAGLIVGRGFDSQNYFAFVADAARLDEPETWLKTLIPPDSGWTLGLATGVNDRGQIVGVGTNPAGDLAYYRLDPVPVPEPTPLAVLAVAGLVALARRRARRPA